MNIRNIKLVKFSDGKYGVRKGFIFHRYADFFTVGFWWSPGSQYMRDCRTADYERAVTMYEALTSSEEVIK